MFAVYKEGLHSCWLVFESPVMEAVTHDPWFSAKWISRNWVCFLVVCSTSTHSRLTAQTIGWLYQFWLHFSRGWSNQNYSSFAPNKTLFCCQHLCLIIQTWKKGKGNFVSVLVYSGCVLDKLIAWALGTFKGNHLHYFSNSHINFQIVHMGYNYNLDQPLYDTFKGVNHVSKRM